VKKFAVGLITLMALVVYAQAPAAKQQVKSTRYGGTSISGYEKITARVSGEVYTFIYTGAGTTLVSDEDDRWVQMRAPKVEGQVSPNPARKVELQMQWAKATGGVHIIIKQKDTSGTVIRTMNASSDSLDYQQESRTFSLVGNVKVETDKPKMIQTGTKGTITLESDGVYTISFADGTTVFKPEQPAQAPSK